MHIPNTRRGKGALAALVVIALAITADALGVASYFGMDRSVVGRLLTSGWKPLAIIGACASLVALALLLLHLRERVRVLERRAEEAQESTRALLEVLYRDTRFRLLRYEREYTLLNVSGDVRLQKTYVLTSPEPVQEMTCYVEALPTDDLERIFQELRTSCTGGTVKERHGVIRNPGEAKAIVRFEVAFDPPVHEEEHTVCMSCVLQKYVTIGGFLESVHMALDTERSVLKFLLLPEFRITQAKTVERNPISGESRDLGAEHFARLGQSGQKWEIASPKFGWFYDVSFEVVRVGP
ncbi:MAG: hypothetical protein U0X73_08360 [Thermoanaerobaculia bacterium]